jgi:hypothetical protein
MHYHKGSFQSTYAHDGPPFVAKQLHTKRAPEGHLCLTDCRNHSCCSALLIECIACTHKQKSVAFFQFDLLPPLVDLTAWSPPSLPASQPVFPELIVFPSMNICCNCVRYEKSTSSSATSLHENIKEPLTRSMRDPVFFTS